jgi:hypothetical protein
VGRADPDFRGRRPVLEWNAVSASTRATDGIDTFVFADDGIRVQTVRYTLETVGYSSSGDTAV